MQFIHHRVANHATITQAAECPSPLYPQSDYLYAALARARAADYLWRCKAKYGQDWGYDAPVPVA